MEALVQSADTGQEKQPNVKSLPSASPENKSLNSLIERSDKPQKDGLIMCVKITYPQMKSLRDHLLKYVDSNSWKMILNFFGTWKKLWLIMQQAHGKVFF